MSIDLAINFFLTLVMLFVVLGQVFFIEEEKNEQAMLDSLLKKTITVSDMLANGMEITNGTATDLGLERIQMDCELCGKVCLARLGKTICVE